MTRQIYVKPTSSQIIIDSKSRFMGYYLMFAGGSSDMTTRSSRITRRRSRSRRIRTILCCLRSMGTGLIRFRRLMRGRQRWRRTEFGDPTIYTSRNSPVTASSLSDLPGHIPSAVTVPGGISVRPASVISDAGSQFSRHWSSLYLVIFISLLMLM